MSKAITIINRHYPPNKGITGESAWDLADYLIKNHQIEVHLLHIGRQYDGGGAVREPVGITHKFPPLYVGANATLRNISALFESFLLIVASIFIRKGPKIVMTSPPLLPMFAGGIYGLLGIKWYLWSMDLFPEGFAAHGDFKKESLFYKVSHWLTYKFAPGKLIALGPMQADFILAKYGKKIDTLVLPCGVLINQQNSTTAPIWYKEGPVYLGYCGNLAQPHSPAFVKEAIRQTATGSFRFILAVYGQHAQEVKNFAASFEHVVMVDSVPREQLHFIDVHLVSLIKSWTHIAVPSKAVSSVTSGSAILFHGEKAADNWQLLQNAGWHIDVEKDLAEEFAAVLPSINKTSIAQKRKVAAAITLSLKNNMLDTYEAIAQSLG